jgi:hypothetical protein
MTCMYTRAHTTYVWSAHFYFLWILRFHMYVPTWLQVLCICSGMLAGIVWGEPFNFAPRGIFVPDEDYCYCCRPLHIPVILHVREGFCFAWVGWLPSLKIGVEAYPRAVFSNSFSRLRKSLCLPKKYAPTDELAPSYSCRQGAKLVYRLEVGAYAS